MDLLEWNNVDVGQNKNSRIYLNMLHLFNMKLCVCMKRLALKGSLFEFNYFKIIKRFSFKTFFNGLS